MTRAAHPLVHASPFWVEATLAVAPSALPLYISDERNLTECLTAGALERFAQLAVFMDTEHIGFDVMTYNLLPPWTTWLKTGESQTRM